MTKRVPTPAERIDEHIQKFEENDHYPWIDFKTGHGRFVNVGIQGHVQEVGESELSRLVMLGLVATQLLRKHIVDLSKAEFVELLRNMNFSPAQTPRPPLTLKRYSMHPDASKLACRWMVEEVGGHWVRFSDLEPEHKGGLSVKAARGIDALLGPAIKVAPTPRDPMEFEAYTMQRMFEGIGHDVYKSILAGKMKRMSQVEKDNFYNLLTAFLRHQLKS